ncbi:uncharacterized protein PHALS_12855 [Plasmopara halstedii]|uniref:Uncharacterized protein n=1 Tax=Plasmopara halstedii TaxID=4781 RepID=A0A0P1APB4_PLAHL|nr:uncharacterized protein PHALS_12855 [Plasmopara halstedii]CEG42593.1 hypothetical protein PHALS_12855 [Plasmopara halstedii]|eukprot:XP_024578962.1 hypothetical protein PHALS_12855 [Plasmopara halstedii]
MYRALQLPVFLLEDDLEVDNEERSEGGSGPPFSKRPIIDEDELLKQYQRMRQELTAPDTINHK